MPRTRRPTPLSSARPAQAKWHCVLAGHGQPRRAGGGAVLANDDVCSESRPAVLRLDSAENPFEPGRGYGTATAILCPARCTDLAQSRRFYPSAHRDWSALTKATPATNLPPYNPVYTASTRRMDVIGTGLCWRLSVTERATRLSPRARIHLFLLLGALGSTILRAALVGSTA